MKYIVEILHHRKFQEDKCRNHQSYHLYMLYIITSIHNMKHILHHKLSIRDYHLCYNSPNLLKNNCYRKMSIIKFEKLYLILHLDRGRMVILKVYWQRTRCSCSWKWSMNNNYNCIQDKFRQAYLLLFITGKSKRGAYFVLELYKLYSYLDCRCKFDILMNTFSRFM